jgi:2-aminoadipate transaminase
MRQATRTTEQRPDSPRDWTSLLATRAEGPEDRAIAEVLRLAGARHLISFGGGFPDPATFPAEALPELVREVLEEGDFAALQYSPTAGLPSVRDVIASRIERLDGRRPADEELLVTSGGIDALEMISKIFLDPGDIVLVEAPTYMGALMAFGSFEANVEGLPMDEDGVDVDALERSLGRGAGPKLFYTIPDHQNPMGASMSLERRRRVVELSARYGFLVVEDVAYRELSFEPPAPSLWSLAPDRVVQIGTFSKIFFPGVRLGWSVGPSDVVGRMVVAKQNTDQCAGALGQRLLEAHARSGGLDASIARARELYGRRCALLTEALARHFPEEARWTNPRGGFFVWATVDGDIDTTALVPSAHARGVAYVPGSVFFPGRSRHRDLRLAYSTVPDDAIDEGARLLGDLLREALAATR